MLAREQFLSTFQNRNIFCGFSLTHYIPFYFNTWSVGHWPFTWLIKNWLQVVSLTEEHQDSLDSVKSENVMLVFSETPNTSLFQYNLVFLQRHPHLFYLEIWRKVGSFSIDVPLIISDVSLFPMLMFFGMNWAAGSFWIENNNQQIYIPNIFSSYDEAVTFNVDLIKSLFQAL